MRLSSSRILVISLSEKRWWRFPCKEKGLNSDGGASGIRLQCPSRLTRP